MVDLNFYTTPRERQDHLKERFRARRKELGFTQKGIAEHSGVSLGSVKRFESTGEISLTSFVKLLATMGYEEDLDLMLQRKGYTQLSDITKDYRKKKKEKNERY
jgi:transcriptional regulator with XRE-family HTH domain